MRSAFSSGEQGGYISPKEYLVALYVIPLWLCLILICLRGSARWSIRRRNGASASVRGGRDDSDNDNLGVGASGDSEGGLNQSSLGQLKEYTFTAAGEGVPDRDSGAKYQTTDCSVCMEAFEEGDRIRELPCGHMFHLECVDEWLKLHPSCPICREDVRDALKEETAGEEEAAPSGSPTSTLDVEQGGGTTSRAPSATTGLPQQDRGGGASSSSAAMSVLPFTNPLRFLRESWNHQSTAVAAVEQRFASRRDRARHAARQAAATESQSPPPVVTAHPERGPRLRFGFFSVQCE
ncbi:RING-type domain-containing protein [Chloropicon primus]|uniref:RING-type domain-containing protein n=1 Tax=Chloropicon primus TaxID=1764295 RepID=A0A5B8MYU6_9CHLO|nr:hypothetical protein A3770_14p73530 [Chloropicon primus]UPR04044.1 RING-type domain-containing protein [Chloropicon primus]|eukprot:QDZ24835.1 hypothetical protein A3770_14p73530 [Chloropicon primus]